MPRKRIKLSEEDVKAFRSTAAQIWGDVADDIEGARRMGENCKPYDHMPWSHIVNIVSDRFYNRQFQEGNLGRSKMPDDQFNRIQEYLLNTSDRTVGKLLKGAI